MLEETTTPLAALPNAPNTLIIGDTVIPYHVRYSSRATRKRIVVTPRRVEVVVPVGTQQEGSSGIVQFVTSRRRWVFNAVHEIQGRWRALLSQQYASGAKLQYRGRGLMLDVQPREVASVEIACRSKFHVQVPHQLEGVARLDAIRQAFDQWLRARALEAVERYVRHHTAELGVTASGYHLSDARRRWGSCSKDGVIRIHWQLIQAPTPALEYVVAHEVVHLLHRNHSPEFWSTLSRTLPDWPDRKAMLERWEGERRGL